MKKKVSVCLIIICLLCISNLFAGDKENSFPLNLLFSKEDVPQIINNTKLPVFKDYWQSLLEADFEKDKNFKSNMKKVVSPVNIGGDQINIVML